MDIVNRLKDFMEKEDISISQFADTCKIPRPTLSQLLNGRNKKVSDEFIGKIHTAFPNLSVVWLLFGEGSMTTNVNNQISEPENVDQSPLSNIQPNEYQQYPSSNPVNKDLIVNNTDNIETHITDSLPASTTRNGDYESLLSANAPQPKTPYYTSKPNSSGDSHYRPIQDLTQSLFDDDGNTYPQSTASQFQGESTGQHKTPDIVFTEKVTEGPKNDIQSTAYTNPHNSPDTSKTHSIRISTTPDKRISNIVVFYSDNSFQSFYPEQSV